MKTVTVKVITTPKAFFWIQIDGAKLAFIDGESEEVSLNEQETYGLIWCLRGAPNTEYQIEVVGTKTKIENKRIAPDKTKALGIRYFEVGDKEVAA